VIGHRIVVKGIAKDDVVAVLLRVGHQVLACVLVMGDDRRVLRQAQPGVRRPGDARVDLGHDNVALGQHRLQVPRKGVPPAADEKSVDGVRLAGQRRDQPRIGLFIAIGQIGGVLQIGVAVDEPVQQEFAHRATVLLLFVDIDAEIVRLAHAVGREILAAREEQETAPVQDCQDQGSRERPAPGDRSQKPCPQRDQQSRYADDRGFGAKARHEIKAREEGAKDAPRRGPGIDLAHCGARPFQVRQAEFDHDRRDTAQEHAGHQE